MSDRVPPHDLQAEQSVLGGMMLSKDAAADAIERVRGGDFYVPKHDVVFHAIVSLYSHGEPTDVVAVADELLKTGELPRAGGAEYLHSLTSIVPTASNTGYYATIVAEKAVLRRLVDAGTRIAQMGFEGLGEPADLVGAAQSEIDRVHTQDHATHPDMGWAFDVWAEGIEATPTYVETPWRELNGMLGGLRPGRFYVIGARPSEGKSIMALQLAHRLAAAGPVAFSSLEMSRSELITRLVSMRSNINMTILGAHQLTAEHWTRISKLRHEVTSLPLIIDDRSGVSIDTIQSFARTVARRGPLAGVVVDYLQLVSGQKGRDRHEVVGDISRRLKVMARDLNCPVIALAQLNRDSVNKGRRAPSLSDLRESGSIEQDADVVLLLQRPLASDGLPTDELHVHVAKNRHGPTGMRALLWEGKFSRVVSRPWGGPVEQWAASAAQG